MKHQHYLIAIGLFFASCSKKNLAPTYDTGSPDQIQSQIIFLTGKVSNINSAVSIDNIEVNIADGKIKQLSAYKKPVSGDIMILELDKKNKQLFTHYIENPLVKTYEYVGEDSLLTKKSIPQTESEFFLRFQKNPSTCILIIKNYSEKDENIFEKKLSLCGN